MTGRFIFPATTPVQFDPDAMLASIDRLLATAPRQMFLTHYGSVTGVADCAPRLKASIASTVRMALDHSVGSDPVTRLAALTAALLDGYVGDACALGVALPEEKIAALLQDDAALNAAGLVVWLDRLARHAHAEARRRALTVPVVPATSIAVV